MAKSKKEEKIDGLAFDKDSAIITDDAVYNIELLGNIEDFSNPKEDTAYIDNDYFYIFRGVLKGRDKDNIKPGIYENKGDVTPKYYLVEPTTDKEKEEYDVISHVNSLLPMSIIDHANAKEEILIAIPESTKVFQPVLSNTDDLLKRVAKLILLKKKVDLDRYKDRFKNKNELFNFKQVIRSGNKLSILIFDRGCDALNLKYSIVVEERSDNDIVGEKLEEPIVVSSEDTYEI